MLKALGNPVRFRIMQTLAERQICITQEIVETTPLAQSTVSQHLKVLREAGLIEGEFEGPATCYCLSESGVRWLKEQIEALAAGLLRARTAAIAPLGVEAGSAAGPACCELVGRLFLAAIIVKLR